MSRKGSSAVDKSKPCTTPLTGTSINPQPHQGRKRTSTLTRLRRIVIGFIRQNGSAVAETMRALNRKSRRVLDLLKFIANTRPTKRTNSNQNGLAAPTGTGTGRSVRKSGFGAGSGAGQRPRPCRFERVRSTRQHPRPTAPKVSGPTLSRIIPPCHTRPRTGSCGSGEFRAGGMGVNSVSRSCAVGLSPR